MIFHKKRNRDLIVVFDYLAQSQKAGVSIRQTLNKAHDMVDTNRLRLALIDLADRVRDGKTISDGMDNYPDLFSPTLLGLCRIGEQTGQLARSFALCRDHVRWVDGYLSKVKKMIRYPVIVSVLLMIFAMLTGFAGDQIFIMILLFLTGLAGALYPRSKICRKIVNQLILLVPVIRDWVFKFELAKFARSVSFLYQSGVDIETALLDAAMGCGNDKIRNHLKLTAFRVQNGDSVHKAFTSDPFFPNMVTRMVYAGEEGGALDKTFLEVADAYDKDVTTGLDITMKIVPPVIVIFLGILFYQALA